MYFKISNYMKVISLKIFVEGYLVTAVQAEDGRQGCAVFIVTISKELQNRPSPGMVPGPPTSESPRAVC